VIKIEQQRQKSRGFQQKLHLILCDLGNFMYTCEKINQVSPNKVIGIEAIYQESRRERCKIMDTRI